jgi:hypothetical protein
MFLFFGKTINYLYCQRDYIFTFCPIERERARNKERDRSRERESARKRQRQAEREGEREGGHFG